MNSIQLIDKLQNLKQSFYENETNLLRRARSINLHELELSRRAQETLTEAIRFISAVETVNKMRQEKEKEKESSNEFHNHIENQSQR